MILKIERLEGDHGFYHIILATEWERIDACRFNQSLYSISGDHLGFKKAWKVAFKHQRVKIPAYLNGAKYAMIEEDQPDERRKLC